VITTCRRALLTGARFWVHDSVAPASHFVPIYDRREEHTRRIGVPTRGFAAAVSALRDQGDRPVRIAAVDTDDPPYHFQLFLDEELLRVVACLGVDQRLGYGLRPGDMVSWTGEVVAWKSDEFPGWVRVRMTDALGRSWFFIDKVPVFDTAVNSSSTLPAPAAIRCRVVRLVDSVEADEPPELVVSTTPDEVAAEDETDQFTVRGEQLRRDTVP